MCIYAVIVVSTLGDSGFFRLQGIKVLWRLQFLEYLRTLSLKFQMARTKIEVVLSLPCWLSQFSWDSLVGRLRTTSIFVRAFWNFEFKVLKYPRNCRLHATLIQNLVKPLKYTLTKSLYIIPAVSSLLVHIIKNLHDWTRPRLNNRFSSFHKWTFDQRIKYLCKSCSNFSLM